MHKTRKGSLDLSINSIVVLILAVTLLSLGLTFINKTFGGATTELEKSLQGISEDRKTQLRGKCVDDLCLESTSMTIARNKKETILMVLNNKLDCDVNANIIINQNSCQIIGNPNPTSSECNAVVLSTFDKQKVSSKQKEIIPLEVNPKNDAESTTYRYELGVDGTCTASTQNRMSGTVYLDVIIG